MINGRIEGLRWRFEVANALFQNCPLLFDRVEIGQIWGEELERTPFARNQLLRGRGFVERRIVKNDGVLGREPRQQAVLNPVIEALRIAIAIKAHGGRECLVLIRGNEAQALRSFARDLSHHARPAWGAAIVTLQRVVKPTLVQIHHPRRWDGGELSNELLPRGVIAFPVSQSFFYD